MATKVTTKGQVTIPKRVRDALGIKAGSKVEFGIAEDGRAFVMPEQKATKAARDDFEKRLARAREKFDIGGLTTDEYMDLIRNRGD